MYTRVKIANLGLSKIGASSITRLDTPVSSLEKHIAGGYDHWRQTELQKYRWNFATVLQQTLTLSRIDDGEEYPFVFAMPTDCLRLIKRRYEDWKHSGNFIFSKSNIQRVSYVRDVDETEMDPLFAEVLACRIAMESTEYVTQSNTKGNTADNKYLAAVKTASQLNAFERGPENYMEDDGQFPFLNSRV